MEETSHHDKNPTDIIAGVKTDKDKELLLMQDRTGALKVEELDLSKK
jgi:hypothetical protein